jgi:hypothetical protein
MVMGVEPNDHWPEVRVSFSPARVFCLLAGTGFGLVGGAFLTTGRPVLSIWGLYLLYVCYLVWFRLSPWAIQNICALLGFFLIASVPAQFAFHEPADLGRPFIATAVCLALVACSYAPVSRFLIRQVFPTAVFDNEG